ncbi:MAG: TetR/AcrR family transcriptional regulator [Lactobacillus sp.]|jgi:AcrR family transcriptional regulator|nr:TetR/AcrR family transcriptional regulator [Lactobacillus sp.]MCI2033915.1 TetR/AcrR family transcriptional regulator [Lactobacillus sp.]
MNQHHRREQILTTAQRLFAEKGFADTTTRELNQTVGIADGLLYYYFPKGKQQLLETIVQSDLTTKIAALDCDCTTITTREALEQRLLALLEQVWALMTSPEGYQVFIITIRERSRLSQPAASRIEQALSGLSSRVAKACAASPLALDETTSTHLAQALQDLFQSTLYTALLVFDQTTLTAPIKQRLQERLHFLLSRC